MAYLAQQFDIIVVGGGHAGCEAALASARMGQKTLLLAISLDSIAMMPCNPSIGGTSKGHLVREVDALGGEMGKNIDKTFIQSRMLNTSKGPAVYSLRAQADKAKYSSAMKQTIENEDNLVLQQAEVTDICTEKGAVTGVITSSDAYYPAKAVILCTGTYVNARCLYGETIIKSGPNGLKNAVRLRKSLEALGIRIERFKTGTPARIDKRSIDFSQMTEQPGDPAIVPFSFETDRLTMRKDQVSCYRTYTNEQTHAIIRENIHRSPMYSGIIEGTGTRYCPSIEDKVVRFADRTRHQIFIEPEGEDTNEMYVQGMSSSLPEDVQIAMYRSIAGLAHCQIMRTAYAIEYDVIDATQLDLSLEFKSISGLYSAGQFNGSSGYEEAAAQGIIAGINAALKLKGKAPLILDRSDAYIGVLIDDLVTKGTKEPYRMMTSRAEYRLLLRQDNADLRLSEKGYATGLLPQARYDRFVEKRSLIEQEIKRAKNTVIAPTNFVNQFLTSLGTTPIISGALLSDLAKRPEASFEALSAIDPKRPALSQEVSEQIGIQIKYEGYIEKQLLQVQSFKKLENHIIPQNMAFEQLSGISTEARQKLASIKPRSVGHASRITGISPADISVLLVHIKSMRKQQ